MLRFYLKKKNLSDAKYVAANVSVCVVDVNVYVIFKIARVLVVCFAGVLNDYVTDATT